MQFHVVSLYLLAMLMFIACRAKCFYGNPTGPNVTCETCLSGYFGPECAGVCSCQNGYCNDGMAGDGLCTVCFPRFFGPTCSGVCRCMLGLCDNRTIGSTGTCQSCRNTWITGELCDSCSQGRWGSLCQYLCSCLHGECSEGLLGNGSCFCQKGWFGTSCNLETPPTTQLGESTPAHSPTSASVNESTVFLTTVPLTTATPTTAFRNCSYVYLVLVTVPNTTKIVRQLADVLNISFGVISAVRDSLDDYGVMISFTGSSAQALYQKLAALVYSGSSSIAAVGISHYKPVYTDELTSAPTTTSVQTQVVIPPNNEPRKNLPFWAIAIITVALIGVLFGGLYLAWIVYVKHVRASEAHAAQEAEAARRLNILNRSSHYTQQQPRRVGAPLPQPPVTCQAEEERGDFANVVVGGLGEDEVLYSPCEQPHEMVVLVGGEAPRDNGSARPTEKTEAEGPPEQKI